MEVQSAMSIFEIVITTTHLTHKVMADVFIRIQLSVIELLTLLNDNRLG